VKQITFGPDSLWQDFFGQGPSKGSGNQYVISGLVSGSADRQEQAMRQRLQTRRVRTWSANSEKLWLPMLIDAMENVARPECRAVPCDRLVLAAVSAHLAHPVSAYMHGVSRFSLRN
jgi:hypothetical protein